jgi:deoxyribodipyrimidine photo-lyase
LRRFGTENIDQHNFEIVDNETTIYWLRRDIRLDDNTGLYFALTENKQVLPLFIFDSNILDDLEDKKDSRIEFIHNALAQLKEELEQARGSLLVLYGDPMDIFGRLKPKAVYCNHDYEPYAVKRDAEVQRRLAANGIPFLTYKDHVIFEKSEVVKDDGNPYTIFTPYSRKWARKLAASHPKHYHLKEKLQNLKQIKPLVFPRLTDLGFEATSKQFPPRIIKTSIIEKYHQQREYPAIPGTTRLSVHIRFGTVSIRKLVQVAIKKNEVWLNELIWREFYQMILWHFPKVVTHSFKPTYDRMEWRNNEKEFIAWCEGKTGYPLVDAGMRELNETGFMHNRLRMITASFLTKHLLIDWRWGEAYFAKKLLDYDLAANNGGWQWAAGSGCDALPYFRIFNPTTQAKNFDPKNEYIKKWIPEFATSKYPEPIIDHSSARARAIMVYTTALK